MSEKQKKKLLVTASTFPRWEGDTEPRFVLDLASHMTNEYDVTVLVPAAPGAKDREKLEGVQVIRYHYFPIHKWETLCYPGAIVPRIREKKVRALLVPFLFLSLYFHLLKILPNYDIVHAHWLIPQGIVQSFFKKPYIVTGHGGDITSLNKGVLRKLKIRCLKRATSVTVVSEHLKKKLQELVPDINPIVIPMGVDTEKFGRQYYVPNYFGQGDKKVVLFVGRLAEKKGVMYLIDAMRKIDAILVIVGDGPLKKVLEQQASDMGKRVAFLGAKTHDELKLIYASADVFVAPSITAKDGDQEGIPTAIMEAMASGLPIVASNSGGISQLIRNGENGLLCEERDVDSLSKSINRVLCEEQLRKKLLDNTNLMLWKYSYIRNSSLYCNVYRNMRSI
ncbi:MAG: glycosyltransferase family 4 protein [Lachnospiraceae bacterium]|nr:glycosyltransferase family 4 protein [Lachnospiraceae bacterium]